MPKRGSHSSHAQNAAARGPRPTWSGSLSFGLVTIPVELFPASHPSAQRAHMLDRDGTQLVRRYYCPDDGEALDDDAIVRGYELPDGKYVVVSDAELEALAPKKSREIDLRLFTERSALHPALFEQTYVLVPAAGANKAYRLLSEVMAHKQRAGIATFVLREREYIVAIVSDGRWLFGQTMRFADELQSADALALPKLPARSDKQLLARYTRALAAVSGGRFEPADLVDPAHRKLAQLLEKKRKQGKLLERQEAASEPASQQAGAEVIDLMQRLKNSLQQSQPARKQPPAQAQPAPRKRARKG